jgi:tetratricopeptide (TPR) repeat protein
MAFLAPDPIPVDMFEEGTEDVKQAARKLCKETRRKPDSLSVQAGLDELADYSLITRQGGEMVTVHRMVQEVLRSQIPGTKKDWIEWVLRIVNRAFPFESFDVRTWPVCDRLRPHATKIAALADEEGITAPTGRLMNQLGLLFLNKGLYAEAEPLMRRALDIDEASFGEKHPNVAIDLNNLALLLQDTNRLDEAEPLMRHALQIDEASFGKEHPDVARDLNNLALLLKATNRLEEAEPLMRRAVDIWERSLGPDHPRTQIGRENLKVLLAKKAAAAEQL